MTRSRRRLVLCLAAGLGLASALTAQEPGSGRESVEPVDPPADESLPAREIRVLRTGGLRVESAALLWSGQQGGPVALAVLALPLPTPPSASSPAAKPSDGRVKVGLTIEAAGGALAAAADPTGRPLPVDVAVYALDERGALAGSLLETIEIPGAAESLPTHGLRFFGGFFLRPGVYSLRVLVGHAASKTIGLATEKLVVPASAPRSVPGFAPGSGSDWLTVSSLDAPSLGLPSFWPLSRRALVRLEGDVPVALFSLGGRAPRPTLETRFELRATGAATGTEPTASVTATGQEEGFERIDVSIPTRGLSAGRYELRVAEPGAPFGAQPDLIFDLVSAEEFAASWAERESVGTSTASVGGEKAAGAAAEETATGRWRRSEASALRATYARILSRLPEKDIDQVADEIAAFEVPLLSGPKAAAREELIVLEGAILRLLKLRDPESLIPVMGLYRQLHGTYQKRGLRQPAMYAMLLVGSLAELYAQAVPTPEGRRLAAGFLISLTPNLDRSGLTTLIEAELKRALELDPELPEALLAQAQVDERHGRYEAAVAGLEKLEARGRLEPEAAVRLAINAARLGRTKDARERFERLLAQVAGTAAKAGNPESANTQGALPSERATWPLALAAQELARLQIEGRDLAGASRTLANGLRAFPEDEKLILLSAALSDRLKTPPDEAREAKARLAAWAPAEGPQLAPRLRYDQLPRERIEALWLELEKAGKDRLAALATALPAGAPWGDR